MSGYARLQATKANQVKEIAELNLANSMRLRQKNIAGKCFTTFVAFGDIDDAPENAIDDKFHNMISLFNPSGSGKLLYVYGIHFATGAGSGDERGSVLISDISNVGVPGPPSPGEDLADAGKINSLNTNLSTTSIAEAYSYPTLLSANENPLKIYWVGQVGEQATISILDFIEDQLILAEGVGILVRVDPQGGGNIMAAQLKWYEE